MNTPNKGPAWLWPMGMLAGLVTTAAEERVSPHHVFPKSGWISFQLESVNDVPFVLSLLGPSSRTPGHNL